LIPRYGRRDTRFDGARPSTFHGRAHGTTPRSSCSTIWLEITSYTFDIAALLSVPFSVDSENPEGFPSTHLEEPVRPRGSVKAGRRPPAGLGLDAPERPMRLVVRWGEERSGRWNPGPEVRALSDFRSRSPATTGELQGFSTGDYRKGAQAARSQWVEPRWRR